MRSTHPDATVQLDQAVAFLQHLIQTRSLPGQEREIAEIVRAKMDELGYEDSRIDAAGNVVGTVRGRGEAPTLAFNTHLDHVDVGDPDGWPHPPYGGEIHDGRIWGRGAVDIKGPLVAQLYGAAPDPDNPPPGDVLVTMVVQEEVGGLGARAMAQQWIDEGREIPAMIVGEPSSNTLRRGHRGRIELTAHLIGKSVHASIPEQGINPLPSLGRFLSRLEEISQESNPTLGTSTVAPTLLRTDQTSANVIPAEVWQTLDWRLVPEQPTEQAVAQARSLLTDCLEANVRGTIDIPVFDRHSYTDYTMSIPADNPAYALDEDHPWVTAAQTLLADSCAITGPVGIWQFATDGGHFARAGVAPIGFGPGDETLAHTVDEHLEIAALGKAIEVNRALAWELAARVS